MHSTRLRQRLALPLTFARAMVRRRTQLLTPEERVLRGNFVLHVMNGAFSGFSDALTSSSIVMTAFLSQLTGSNFLIALISPLRDAGWFLPQFFVAPWVEHTRRKVSAYRTGTVFRIAAWLALVASAFLIRDRAVLLVAVLICITVFSIVSGFAALPFLIVTAKIIPANQRGLIFGLRQFIGGALGVVAGGAVSLILGGQSGLPFPQNYAILFACATAGYALSYASLGSVTEAPDDVPSQITPLLVNLKEAWAIARNDKPYQRYVLMRTALLVGTACVPFLTVYAKRVLSVSDGFIGTLVSATLASSLLSNVVWARLCDRRGNRSVIVITTVMGLIFCALAALMTGVAPSAANSGWMQLVLVLLFAVSGAFLAGINLVSNPLMIEIAAPAHQSLYIGLSNSILGVVLLLTSLVGVIVDRYGFSALFAFSAVAFVVALERLTRMRDPRRS